MIDLDKLRTFYYVALEGRIGKAEIPLDLSSPSISKHIHALERQCNVKLFLRKRKGLQLTEQGKQLYPIAKKVVKDIEEFLQQISKDDSTASK